MKRLKRLSMTGIMTLALASTSVAGIIPNWNTSAASTTGGIVSGRTRDLDSTRRDP